MYVHIYMLNRLKIGRNNRNLQIADTTTVDILFVPLLIRSVNGSNDNETTEGKQQTYIVSTRYNNTFNR